MFGEKCDIKAAKIIANNYANIFVPIVMLSNLSWYIKTSIIQR